MAKSPYAKYEKRRYEYVYPRCSHTNAHVQQFSVVEPLGEGLKRITTGKVRVCDVCHTMQGQSFHIRHRVMQRRG